MVSDFFSIEELITDFGCCCRERLLASVHLRYMTPGMGSNTFVFESI